MKKRDMCFYVSITKDKNSSSVASGEHTIVDLKHQETDAVPPTTDPRQVTMERCPSFFVFWSAAALSEKNTSVVILP